MKPELDKIKGNLECYRSVLCGENPKSFFQINYLGEGQAADDT